MRGAYRILNSSFVLALAMLVIASCVWSDVKAQSRPADSITALSDPVEELCEILRCPSGDPAERDRALKDVIPSIQGVGNLRRALLLREWRDTDSEEKWAGIDRAHRGNIARRFKQGVRDILQQSDETARLAVLSLLTDFGNSSQGENTGIGLVRDLGADLAALMANGNPATRLAAAQVLAEIDPDPDIAIPAFASMLSAKESSERIAAAEDLAAWMRFVANLAARDPRNAGVGMTRSHLVKVGQAIVPLAGRALNDADPIVRRSGLQTISQAAQALRGVVTAGCLPKEIVELDDVRRRVDQERSELLPLIVALKNQVAALTRVLADPDADVLALARKTLEDMADPQLRLLERANRVAQDKTGPAASQPSTQLILPSSLQPDSFVQGLHEMVETLAAALADKDVRARRAVANLLESLGPVAAPAAASLIAALGDSDPFVRWTAARTLGKISPVAAATAVPGLARLLEDDDLDLRLAAAAALERCGPEAAPAAGALIESAKSTETELRVASIRALAAIGVPCAYPAIPILRASLADPDHRVRQMAAIVLGKFGLPARETEDALRKALHDKNADVQKAAGEALLDIKHPVRK
jgi:HEAT repeat protein